MYRILFYIQDRREPIVVGFDTEVEAKEMFRDITPRGREILVVPVLTGHEFNAYKFNEADLIHIEYHASRETKSDSTVEAWLAGDKR